MIFKQETQILKCTFEKEHFSKVKAAFKDRWPVVYIIEDDEKGQAYIGESTNICTRICDHWNNTERRALKNIYIIFNKVFNLKSATPFPKCYLHKEKWTFDS